MTLRAMALDGDIPVPEVKEAERQQPKTVAALLESVALNGWSYASSGSAPAHHGSSTATTMTATPATLTIHSIHYSHGLTTSD